MSTVVMSVVNESNLMDDATCAVAVEACRHQLKYHAAPAWDRHNAIVNLVPRGSLPPVGTYIILIQDDPDVDGALGYHDETQAGTVYAKVFVKPVLDNGGSFLGSSGFPQDTFSVSGVLSHEILEAFGDAHVNQWADAGDPAGPLVALELCDPVESDSYMIETKLGEALVSNFVTPHWFDSRADSNERFDWMRKTASPFEMTPGGYVILLQNGQVTSVWGREYPEWKKGLKQRILKRGGGVGVVFL